MIDGITDIIGGFLSLLTSSQVKLRFIEFLTKKEILEDPNDFVANGLLKIFQNLSSDTQIFAGIYLLVYGIIKTVLVVSIFSRKLWAYKFAGITLFFLVIYQLYRFYLTHSIFLLILTILDILLLVLMVYDYKNFKIKN